MQEIGQFFESALRKNSEELREAALRTVAAMGAEVRIRELLESEASDAIRELSLRDLVVAVAGHRRRRAPLAQAEVEAEVEVDATANAESQAGSDAERIYRAIIEQLGAGPSTIGQLAKAVSIEADELRGYLDWMKRMGKVSSTGRARATRYLLVE